MVNVGMLTRHDGCVSIARQTAASVGIDPALVCAIVEQESGWNPLAMRYEPAFYSRYVEPLIASGQIKPATATEAWSRAVSWGLMQIMGQCARELGFEGAYLSELCDVATGLELGCKLLARKLALSEGDVGRALELWNGGASGMYAHEVMARLANYGQA